MENPKCPYCGGEMRYAFNGDIIGTHFLICETCLSRSPVVSFNDDPYAAAMKRDRVKGEWIEAQDYLFDNIYTCSACGSEFVLEAGTPKDNEYNFCPNCGAEMKEANDE